MITKTFQGSSISEALEKVKKEMGPEAIILQTRKAKNALGFMSKAAYEVIASISETSLKRRKQYLAKFADSDRQAIENLPADRQAQLQGKWEERKLEHQAATVKEKVEISRERKGIPFDPMKRGILASPKRLTATRYAEIDPGSSSHGSGGSPMHGPDSDSKNGISLNHYRAELDALKAAVQELRSRPLTRESELQDGVLSKATYQDMFELLIASGLERREALSLLKQAEFELGDSASTASSENIQDQVASVMLHQIETLSFFGEAQTTTSATPWVHAFVGSAGSGKTSTLSKIAVLASQEKKLRVALIELDPGSASFMRNGHSGLKNFATEWNLPHRQVIDAESLAVALQELKSMDLILVDTPGYSRKDDLARKGLESLLHSVPSLRTQLVVSATTRDADLYIQSRQDVDLYRPEGLMVTKMDDAFTHGNIFTLSRKVKLPLEFFTTGRRVSGDLEEATRERLVALILGL